MRISARLLKKTLLRTDERAKLEGELLDGMDVVKCMTWEVSCCDLGHFLEFAYNQNTSVVVWLECGHVHDLGGELL